MWFSYDGDFFSTHETAAEARKSAEESLDDYRSNANDGWNECAYRACWGKVTHTATVVNEREADHEEDLVSDDIDMIQEIELRGDCEYHCNTCGGSVSFDGTPPAKGN